MLALIGLSLFRVAFARLAFWPPASCSIAIDAVCLSTLSRAATAAFVGLDAFGAVATELVAGGGVAAVTDWSVVGGVAAATGCSVVGVVAAVTDWSVVGGVAAATGCSVVGDVAAMTSSSVMGGVAAVEGFSAVVVGVETGTDVSALAGGFGASATEGA
jgi:hypothetical protein